MQPQTSATPKEPGTRWTVIAAFGALGFTTSLMNAMNETPGATQAYLPLIFAFVGGAALSYTGLAKESASNPWSAVDFAGSGVLALCMGALLGLPSGLIIRVWAQGALYEPNSLPKQNAFVNTAPSRSVDVALHAGTPCRDATRVLIESHQWLADSDEGRLLEAQYRVLMRSAGCELVQ